MLGEYRTRCLFSKTWSLREAVIKKIRLMLRDLEASPGLAVAIVPLADVLKVGVDDKIAQVMSVSVLLLEDMLNAVKRLVSSCLMFPMIVMQSYGLDI